jgi:hypothetical protein
VLLFFELSVCETFVLYYLVIFVHTIIKVNIDISLSIYLSIYLCFVCLSMALQPFVGPSPFFKFLDFYLRIR